MNKKRILSWLLALTLAGTAILSSCDTKKPADHPEQPPVEQPADEGPKLVLPDIDGGGEDFDIFLAYNVFDGDFIVEEETGDLLKDTIYLRNRNVQDRFHVNFKFRRGDSTNSEATPIIRSLIQAGDDTYEVYVNVQHVGIPLIYEDLFVDWNEQMPYANLENPWWYSNVLRDLNFGDKVYVVAGAYNFHCLKAAATIAFNKTMLDEIGLDYPYELVLDGKWTIDKMLEYSKAAQKDLNGDGVIDEDNDRLGFSGWKWEMIPAMFIGMGGTPVIKNEEDLPELNINNERTFKIIDKMIEFFGSGNGSWSNGRQYGFEDLMFKESRLLFNDGTLSSMPGLRSLEDDFGCVPYPKLDENQEEYYSRIVNFSSLTYIPVTNTKTDLTSAILEYMAYLSYEDLIPAFYDVILTVKTNRDVESEAMVDIIRNSARFMDENYLNSGAIIRIVEGGQNTLASNYAAYGDAWEERLEDIVDFWTK